jgi:hypothetical protein
MIPFCSDSLMADNLLSVLVFLFNSSSAWSFTTWAIEVKLTPPSGSSFKNREGVLISF